MNILVLGGTYFIGRILVKLLLLNKHSVSMLNRGTRKTNFNGVEAIIADRHNETDIYNALKDKNFDVVIDLSGYNKNDVSAVVNSLGNKINQYIFCSSIAVCSQPPNYWPITEDHKKCSSVKESEYGYNKLLAERCLLKEFKKNNLAVSIVRPVYVYGPHDYNGRLEYFFERIINGQTIMISGNGQNIIQFGYVYDLCRSIIAMIGDKNSYGETFNVSGRELITIEQLINVIFSVIRKETDVMFNVDNSVNSENVSALTNQNRFADISKAEKVLGIVPEISLFQGIKMTYYDWLIKGGKNETGK